MQLRKQSGFTLVEVIVVAGIIAILAGILVPLILKEIDESRITRAAADVRSISSAMIILKKDTGQWPINATCAPGTTLLQSNAIVPAAAGGIIGWDTTAIVGMDDFLMTDDNGCWGARWKGPYLVGAVGDPWGNAYIINADQFSVVGTPVWILSAGPNGVIDTPASAVATMLDDIGLRLK